MLFLRLLSLLLPWLLRRRLLEVCFGYQIHPTARIGLTWAFPRKLIMEEHTSIGHLTVCKNLDLVHLKQHASIGRGNWITGFPTGTDSKHFRSEPERRAELILEQHAAVTNRHLIDATNRVIIGRFATFAGFASQILTHTIDIVEGRQSSKPVTIGAYAFVGTSCVILGGSALPDYSVLGAKSLLNDAYIETHQLYGGVPAKPIKSLPKDAAYFTRDTGFVD
jgi:acetyltransferase-like isoleucine patch superfamily enzyme